MAQIGRLRNIGLGKETTKGTAVSPTFWVPVESGFVKPLVEYAQDESNFGRIEAPVKSHVVREDAVTNFSAVARADWLGAVLKATLGTSASALASGESAVWEHTFTVLNSNDHPAYTITMKDGIAAECSVYSMLSRMTLSCEARGLLMCEAEYVGRQLASDTETVTYSSDHVWKGSQGSVKLATSLSGLSGASAVAFHKLSLTFEKNLVQHPSFGSITLSENLNGPLRITGELELLHANNTYRDFVTDGTDRAMRIAFAGDSVGNAETVELQINLARCAFEEWEIEDGNDDLQIETIRFAAQYDADEGSPQMVNVVLTNEENTSAY